MSLLGAPLLSGELWGLVKSDETIWTVEDVSLDMSTDVSKDAATSGETSMDVSRDMSKDMSTDLSTDMSRDVSTGGPLPAPPPPPVCATEHGGTGRELRITFTRVEPGLDHVLWPCVLVGHPEIETAPLVRRAAQARAAELDAGGEDVMAALLKQMSEAGAPLPSPS